MNHAVKRFVREVLACRCDDQVFESVSLAASPPGPETRVEYEIQVGGRLLVLVVARSALQVPGHEIPRLVDFGLRRRASLGFQRLRIAIVRDVNRPSDAACDEAFRSSAHVDARTHLHFVSPEQVAPLAVRE